MTTIARTSLLSAAAFFAMAAAAPLPPPAVTEHRLDVDGRQLVYRAEVGLQPIGLVSSADDAGGNMSYTAYAVDGAGANKRPIMFFWGGGPGGNSSYMNFEFAGPIRPNGTRFIADGAGLVASPETLLTDMDLVFPDAPGTGFGDVTDERVKAKVYGVVGDTIAFADFIQRWIETHHAQGRPLFIGGISYGGNRGGTVAYELLKRHLPLRGVVLMNGGMGITRAAYVDPSLLSALGVVHLAEAAYYHGKLSPGVGATRADVARAADAWARKVYAPALKRKDSLTPEQRAQVVAGLSRFSGIAREAIDSETLVIWPGDFAKLLLKDSGRTLYGSDLRLTEPIGMPYEPAMLAYFQDALKFTGGVKYRMYDPAIDKRWDWATSPVTDAERAAARAAAELAHGPQTLGRPYPAIAEAVALDPNLKILVQSGRYDAGSSCQSHAETVQNLTPAALKSAFILRCYNTGHSVQRTPSERLVALSDIKEMVRIALLAHAR